MERLSDIIDPKSAKLIWKQHYNEIIALIRATCRCDEERAQEVSHTMYITSIMTGNMDRWNRSKGCSLSTWVTYWIRSYNSVENKKRKRLQRLDISFTSLEEAGELEGRCLAEHDVLADRMMSLIKRKFGTRIHTSIFDLLLQELSHTDIALRLGLTRSYTGNCIEEIRTFLRNKV